MLETIFKPIKKAKGYGVNVFGQVINLASGKILKPYARDSRNRPYMCVTLFIRGVKKTAYVHRIVATTYIDNPHKKKQVNHKDGDKTNNHVSNLEWVTNQENQDHRWKKGKYERN